MALAPRTTRELPFSPVTRGSQHIPGEMEPAVRLILMPYSLPSLSPNLGWRPHLFLLLWALLPFCFPFGVEEWPLAQQDSPKQHGFSRHGAVGTLNRTLPAAPARTASACLAPVEVSDSQRPDWSRGKGHSPTRGTQSQPSTDERAQELWAGPSCLLPCRESDARGR